MKNKIAYIACLTMSPWVILLIAVWGFFYRPCFLTGQAYGLHSAPWVMLAFGSLALLTLVIKEMMEKHMAFKKVTVNQY